MASDATSPRFPLITAGDGSGPAGTDSARSAPWARWPFLIAAWWIATGSAGALVVVFAPDFLPAKFSLDAIIMRALLDSPTLWEGLSYDSFVNTARVWSLVFLVLPEVVGVPLYYGVLLLVTLRALDVMQVRLARYHLFAAAWLICMSLFVSLPNKETIALPVALWLCLARSPGARLLATAAFLGYAAFFRQYWAICFFYFACTIVALRLAVAKRGGLAAALMAASYVLPFAAAAVFGYDPLTDARLLVNADRVDSPDARSAFNNTFENTGFVTDVANAAIAWSYMNVPIALAAKGEPHYALFAALQVCSLWFFAAGCAAYLRDARKIGDAGCTYLRCSAFVIAYSLTQSLFEPDFGSFLRHEAVFVVPMLIVSFYRGHSRSSLRPQPMGHQYAGNLSSHI